TDTGRVVRVERCGLFVGMGAERPGLLHAREMGKFNRPDMYRVGDEIDVRILQLDRRKKRIDLALAEAEMPPEEREEPLPSPIELAFRRAMEEARRQGKAVPASSGKGRGRHQAEQDEILNQTLRQISR
ncbi:MAG: S1 RNA-binding domain-containing protein, partial [Anaerolineae bacterium]|nr:S1 RNA-binding domain-containing protein [Anaerolineae bacterium]